MEARDNALLIFISLIPRNVPLFTKCLLNQIKLLNSKPAGKKKWHSNCYNLYIDMEMFLLLNNKTIKSFIHSFILFSKHILFDNSVVKVYHQSH